jgi:hypothetical protein
MMKFVRVKQGFYAGKDIVDVVLPFVKGIRSSNKGNFITVNGAMYGQDRNVRVMVESNDNFEIVAETEYTGPTPENYVPEFVAEEITPVVAEPVVEKSEEEAMNDIKESFEILDDMARAVCNGDVRALIVAGPPGVGKSFGVEKIIEPYCLFDHISGKHLRAEVVKGSASALGLYQTLYNYRDQNSVLVFDDCDTILFDDVSLNLLKGALDSGKKRKISWLSESRVLADAGIPNSFEFNGGVIFITNLKFDKVKSGKLKEHLDALQSRCHYLDLTLDTMRDKFLRIKQVARDCDLFAEMDLEPEEQAEVLEFMETNQANLREMSLRMAIKVAQLRKSFSKNWRAMAERTCAKNG